MHRALLTLIVLAAVVQPAAASPQKRCARIERRLVAVEGQLAVHPEFPRLLRKQQRYARSYADRCVALNHVQVLGTHNSYHVQPRPTLLAALLAITPLFRAWEYTHLPLDQQFSTQGIRQIELDVYTDPAGGLFATRHGLLYVDEDPVSGLPALDQPGLKVIHIPDVDFETRCLTFVECLQTIDLWSHLNPGHLPITVLVELKDEAIPDIFDLGFVTPIPFGAADLDALDAEIRSVFPEGQIITPDDVRGRAATLEQAVLTTGWPLLSRARGKVLFLMDNGGGLRDLYRAGRPNLEGRVLFTNATPGDADAAFVKRNDPLEGDPDDIPDLVRAGYLVRTRTDGDTEEARSGDTTMRDAAIVSGAQYVSTDYPVENPAFGTGYKVEIPGGLPARCNPVNAPSGCRAAALEHFR